MILLITILTFMYYLVDQRFAFIVLLSYFPSILYIIVIRLTDVGAKEPRGIIAWNIAWGIILLYPAVFLELNFLYILVEVVLKPNFPDFFPLVSTFQLSLFYALIFFLIVAPVEEGLKFLAFFIANLFHKENDVPSDPIIYAASIGAGFAIFENAAYILGRGFENGISVYEFYLFNLIQPLIDQEFDYEMSLLIIIVRTICATPLHIGLGLLMGYYLSKFIFGVKLGYSTIYRIYNLILAIVIPTLIHAIYNTFTFTLYLYFPGQFYDVIGATIFAFMFSFLAWRKIYRFRKHVKENHISSF
jgi:protease PrsW